MQNVIAINAAARQGIIAAQATSDEMLLESIADGGRTVRGRGGSGALGSCRLVSHDVPSREATVLPIGFVNPQFPEPKPSTRESMTFAILNQYLSLGAIDELGIHVYRSCRSRT